MMWKLLTEYNMVSFNYPVTICTISISSVYLIWNCLTFQLHVEFLVICSTMYSILINKELVDTAMLNNVIFCLAT